MQSDRESLPERANPSAPHPSLGELNACIQHQDTVERALQIARWIYTIRSSFGPKHANAWDGNRIVTAKDFADHRNAVTFVELTNATTLATLCEVVEGLQRGYSEDRDEERKARRMLACGMILNILEAWMITEGDLADRGDGVTKPYESWRKWAARMARLPQCYPPPGYEPPAHKPASSPEPERFGGNRPTKYRRSA